MTSSVFVWCTLVAAVVCGALSQDQGPTCADGDEECETEMRNFAICWIQSKVSNDDMTKLNELKKPDDLPPHLVDFLVCCGNAKDIWADPKTCVLKPCEAEAWVDRDCKRVADMKPGNLEDGEVILNITKAACADSKTRQDMVAMTKNAWKKGEAAQKNAVAGHECRDVVVTLLTALTEGLMNLAQA